MMRRLLEGRGDCSRGSTAWAVGLGLMVLGVLFLGGTPAFADHGLILTPDVGGSDDETSQNDITQMGFDSSHTTETCDSGFCSIEGDACSVDADCARYFVSFSFDDSDYPGGNTGDGCTLFDSDGDGLADFSLCVEIKDLDADGDADYFNSFWYDCKDTNDNRCFTTGGGGDGSSGLIAEDITGGTCDSGFCSFNNKACSADADCPDGILDGLDSNCSLTLEETDPFPGDPRPDTAIAADCNNVGGTPPCETSDVVVTCEIFVDEFVELDGDPFPDSTLTNVCTFPSPQANSDDKDCIVSPGSAFLIVEKVADPDDGTAFKFTLDGNAFVTINGSGISDAEPLAAGDGTTYDLAEVVPSGWQLDSASCDDESTCDVDTQTCGVLLTSGDRVTCTFTDSLTDLCAGVTCEQDTNVCTVAVCDPADGICKPQSANGGAICGDEFSCSDTGDSSGGGTCTVTAYTCQSGVCVGDDTIFTDTCGGTADSPSVTFYSCNVDNNACDSGETSEDDSCTDTGSSAGGGSCSATDWTCSAGQLSSTSSSGADTCSGDDVVTTTVWSCSASDGTAVTGDDTCISGPGDTGTDECTDTGGNAGGGSCGATNYFCINGNEISSTDSGGDDTCSGDDVVTTTVFSCSASDGTAVTGDDTCSSGDGDSGTDSCEDTGGNAGGGSCGATNYFCINGNEISSTDSGGDDTCSGDDVVTTTVFSCSASDGTAVTGDDTCSSGDGDSGTDSCEDTGGNAGGGSCGATNYFCINGNEISSTDSGGDDTCSGDDVVTTTVFSCSASDGTAVTGDDTCSSGDGDSGTDSCEDTGGNAGGGSCGATNYFCINGNEISSTDSGGDDTCSGDDVVTTTVFSCSASDGTAVTGDDTCSSGDGDSGTDSCEDTGGNAGGGSCGATNYFCINGNEISSTDSGGDDTCSGDDVVTTTVFSCSASDGTAVTGDDTCSSGDGDSGTDSCEDTGGNAGGGSCGATNYFCINGNEISSTDSGGDDTCSGDDVVTTTVFSCSASDGTAVTGDDTCSSGDGDSGTDSCEDTGGNAGGGSCGATNYFCINGNEISSTDSGGDDTCSGDDVVTTTVFSCSASDGTAVTGDDTCSSGDGDSGTDSCEDTGGNAGGGSCGATNYFCINGNEISSTDSGGDDTCSGDDVVTTTVFSCSASDGTAVTGDDTCSSGDGDSGTDSCEDTGGNAGGGSCGATNYFCINGNEISSTDSGGDDTCSGDDVVTTTVFSCSASDGTAVTGDDTCSSGDGDSGTDSCEDTGGNAGGGSCGATNYFCINGNEISSTDSGGDDTCSGDDVVTTTVFSCSASDGTAVTGDDTCSSGDGDSGTDSCEDTGGNAGGGSCGATNYFCINGNEISSTDSGGDDTCSGDDVVTTTVFSCSASDGTAVTGDDTCISGPGDTGTDECDTAAGICGATDYVCINGNEISSTDTSGADSCADGFSITFIECIATDGTDGTGDDTCADDGTQDCSELVEVTDSQCQQAVCDSTPSPAVCKVENLDDGTTCTDGDACTSDDGECDDTDPDFVCDPADACFDGACTSLPIAVNLTVIKNVENLDGGGLEAMDFTLGLTGEDDFPGDSAGTEFAVVQGASYTVSEDLTNQPPAGDLTGFYAASFDGDCDTDALCASETGEGLFRTCTVTNTELDLQNQRSIQISNLDVRFEGVYCNSIRGSFDISNESEQPIEILFTNLDLFADYKDGSRGKFTDLEAFCTTVPEEPFLWYAGLPDTLTVTYTCDLNTCLTVDDAVRVTALAEISDRRKAYSFRTSIDPPLQLDCSCELP